jgi:predicted transcriptional regulator
MADTTSLKLPEDLKDRVAKVAPRVEQTPHAYMVQAISEKVARDEKRQAFWEEGQKSLEEFKRTGIAYRFEDVEKYILAKAQGKKVRRPKPMRISKEGR